MFTFRFCPQKSSEGEDCMFRALALCRGVRASSTHRVRTAIVKHICGQVNDGGEYWNDDCKSLLTTLGLNINLVLLVPSTGVETCRTVLGGDPLRRILNCLCGETTT